MRLSLRAARSVRRARPIFVLESRAAQARGAGPGFDEGFDASLADVDVEFVAVDDGDLGFVRAAFAGEGDERFGQIAERRRLFLLFLHDLPPTVIFSIRRV